ncbi:MAG: GNAT family N-acetyltransferase [Phycisphaeraceae bacterium]|nr:GNAT family N-acetyltransferase [Phycisphaeraceae bacterium]
MHTAPPPHFIDDGRTLRTERLALRPWQESDLEAIVALNDDPEIERNTTSVTLPYTREKGMEALAKFARSGADGTGITRAWCLVGSNEPVGGIGLMLNAKDNNAELGYSTRRDHRKAGYTTEACAAMLDWAFGDLGLHRVFARHFTWNPASERVMDNLGMLHEGVQREHGKKGDLYLDLCCHAILAREWKGTKRT